MITGNLPMVEVKAAASRRSSGGTWSEGRGQDGACHKILISNYFTIGISINFFPLEMWMKKRKYKNVKKEQLRLYFFQCLFHENYNSCLENFTDVLFFL